MDKIFHVFVSSTYTDLIDERKKVSEAVAKAGYVAEGMEIFPASSQKQMDFIERVIDRCDYYILIVAGRYGSLSGDGMSFTEKEFHYATLKSIPVLAFIRNDLGKLPADQTEKESEKQKKLDAFIGKLKTDAMVDFWSNPDELATKALAALSHARVSHEGVGWIRADKAAGTDILGEINELRKSNTDLSARLASIGPSPIFEDINLAGLDENFQFSITVQRKGYTSKRTNIASLSWRTILATIGADYRTASNTSGMNYSLQKAIRREMQLATDVTINVDIEVKERILMQMEALGMMRAETYSLKNGGSAVFHILTDAGLGCMLRANVVKSSKKAGSK